MKIAVKISEEIFDATLENNETSRSFVATLPFEATMNELNGNEKYCYLEEPLPSNPKNIGTIHAGDIMLYGDDCLVIFYKTFETNYSYTRIGKIENFDNLVGTVGRGNILIQVTANIE